MTDLAPHAGGGERIQNEEERLAELVLRRSKLTAREAALLRAVFTKLMATHHRKAWGRLRRRGLKPHEIEDLIQDSFVALYFFILEEGFPDDLPKKLGSLVDGRFLSFLRARRRSPESLGLPSSGSEPFQRGSGTIAASSAVALTRSGEDRHSRPAPDRRAGPRRSW